MTLTMKRLQYLGLSALLALALLYALFGHLRVLNAAHHRPENVFIVTTTDDSGPGSLREAMATANANSGADHILFDLDNCDTSTPCIISLQSPLPPVSDTLAITGTGMHSLILDANGAFRGLNVGQVEASIADLTIQNGFTPGRGAGIRNFGDLTLRRVRLLNNLAGQDGGAVYAGEGLVAFDSLFQGNDSGRDGGAIFSEFAVVVTRTTFISNTADGDGGAIAASITAVVDGLFAQNRSMEVGGGLFSNHVVVSNTRFFQNVALADGGGIAGFGVLHILGSTFQENWSLEGSGGGLSASAALLPVTTPGRLEERQAPSGLGQMLFITRTHFISNMAAVQGGGVAAYGPLQVDSSTFVGNRSAVGGGLALEHREGFFVNTLFARNKANNGPESLALNHSPAYTVTMLHNTIAGPAGSNQAGIGVDGGALIINNTIVASHSVGIRVITGTVNEDYLLFYGNGANTVGAVNSGGHSLEGDPRFVAPENDDYHLSYGSAAIDAGAGVGVIQDYEHQPRPLGAGYDIGFDEADLIEGLAITYTPNPTVSMHLPAIFTATVSSSNVTTYTWDFGDGSALEVGNPIDHTFTAEGFYTVTVFATNSAGTLSHAIAIEVIEDGVPPPASKTYLPVFYE